MDKNIENLKEKWKPVVGYEGLYEVSNLGRVKSLERHIVARQYNRKLDEHILHTYDNGRGYQILSLNKDGQQTNHKVHRIVAEAFIPNPNNYPVVNHKDGNKKNNNVDNLEWTTHQQNTKHAIETGLLTPLSGEQVYCHKLTWGDIMYIRKYFKTRDKMYGGEALSKKFNVSASTIIRAAKGLSWKKNMEIKIKYENGVEDIMNVNDGEWYDLRSSEDVVMNVGDFYTISLGVCIKLPQGYEAIVAPRSSTFRNYGIIMANGIGIIDNKYCGNQDVWKFQALKIYGDTVTIHKNDRICQFRIQECQPPLNIISVDNMEDESRGGLGSTGVN